MKELNEEYTRIATHIQTRITNAKESEEMDKFKYNLNMNKVTLNMKSTSCFDKIMFLLK